jgi:UDP-glucose 6-dehydrogenase
MGFGGACFPKDINATIKTMEENGIDPLVLKSVWEQNKVIRKNWDWSDLESAALTTKKTNT